MADAQDSEALSTYLTDLQNQVRAPSPPPAAVVRVLAEPLSFLGLVTNSNQTADANAKESGLHWAGPVVPTVAKQLYFIQHLLPNHLDFILDNITLNWLSALPSSQQTGLFEAYFVPRRRPQSSRPTIVEVIATVKPSCDDDVNDDDILSVMAVVSLQTLVNRIQARQFQENHSFLNKTILRLLRKLLDAYSLMDFYRGCLRISGGGKDVEDTLWDSFLSRLFSIPTRVSNALGGSSPLASARVEIEECFQEGAFFKRQAVHLQKCLDSIPVGDGAKNESLRIQRARSLAVVIAKFLRLGYGKILVDSMVTTLWDLSDATFTTRTAGWKSALTHSSSLATTQLFLTTLVDYLNGHQLDFRSDSVMNRRTGRSGSVRDKELSPEQQVAAVHRASSLLVSTGFGIEGEKENGKKKSNSNNFMVEEVLFQGRVFGIGVLRMLICVQSGWPTGVQSGKDSVLAKTFKKALEIWSDAMLVNHASVEYQKYVSYQLLLMIGYFSQQALIEADLILILGAGMSSWLDLESFQRKQIGLVVAEEFSKAVDSVGTPADFDLDGANTEIQFARSIVQLKDGSRPYIPRVSSLMDRVVNSGRDKVESRLEPTAQFGMMSISEQVDSDDEEDPDAIVNLFTRSSAFVGDGGGDSSDDGDDGLKPYAMDYESDPDEEVESVKKANVTAPLYLRDLISYLRASEDRDKIELGLRTAAELIRRKAGSLESEEFAEALSNTLVQLQDSFDLPNFYKTRENAMVALVATAPVIASGALTFQFYEKKNSLGQRLNILTALALGAQELSGFDRPPTASAAGSRSGSAARTSQRNPLSTLNTTAASSTSTLVTQQVAPTFDSITSSISLARTRRFSQKSQIEASRPAPKANAFSNLAPVFLGGLLGRWGGNRGAGAERGYDALQKAPVMVLKKFVVTLGVLVHYTGNSPHLLPITRELFRFLLALRYHTPPAQATPGPRSSPSSSSSAFATPSLTTLKLPGDIGISTSLSSQANSTAGSSLSILSSSGTGSLPYNPDMLESILFDLLILLTPSSAALPDNLLLHEFYAEIMECQQWAMELWEVYKLEQGAGGDGDKARMYCAALLQRCFELMEVSM